MEDESFRELSDAARKLRARVDSLRANIVAEETLVRGRACMSLGMLPNGTPVHFVYQMRSLLKDAESYKRAQTLWSLVHTTVRLAESLDSQRLAVGLKILQKGRPELVNEDIVEIIANLTK